MVSPVLVVNVSLFVTKLTLAISATVATLIDFKVTALAVLAFEEAFTVKPSASLAFWAVVKEALTAKVITA